MSRISAGRKVRIGRECEDSKELILFQKELRRHIRDRAENTGLNEYSKGLSWVVCPSPSPFLESVTLL